MFLCILDQPLGNPPNATEADYWMHSTQRISLASITCYGSWKKKRNPTTRARCTEAVYY